MTLGSRLRRRLAAEDGYTFTELVTVLAILGTVLAALTALFVSATKAEIDMNERFQAQQNARLALNKIRREIHCARTATALADGRPFATALTLTPASTNPSSYCNTTQASWCTEALGASRWGLFRKPGTTCDATGVKVADYMTQANVFDYAPPTAETLATIGVDVRVDIAADGSRVYRLQDRIAMRRSGRTG